MYRALIFTLLFSCSVSALAFQFPIEVTEYIDDVRIDAYINRDDIKEEDRWNPFATAPPLSIQDALRAVRNAIESSGKAASIDLIGIELKRIPRHLDHWHYLVKVKTLAQGKARPHFYVVLMSGKVVSAFREPESIK